MGNTGSSHVPKQPPPRERDLFAPGIGQQSYPPPIAAPNVSILICDVCNKYIERSDNLRQLNFWDSTFCKMHLVDGTPRCSGCDKFKTEGQEYVNLGYDRKLCPDCDSIAIYDPSQCSRLIEKMREFYKELNLEVDKDIPILLVDKDYMEKRVHGAVGLTTFKHTKVWAITDYSKNGDTIEVRKAEKTLTKGKVTSILLLFGMPDVIMGAILAHEMMHAWLILKGCKKLHRKVSEGICEVMADLWLKWFYDEGKNNWDSYTTEQAEFTKKLKRFHAYKMTARVDNIYGDGFKEALRAVSTSNLHKTLQHIVRYKTLPPQIHSNSTCTNIDEINRDVFFQM